MIIGSHWDIKLVVFSCFFFIHNVLICVNDKGFFTIHKHLIYFQKKQIHGYVQFPNKVAFIMERMVWVFKREKSGGKGEIQGVILNLEGIFS